ncbi:SDR family NAD(P)-dependent oxidoreductase [Granulicella sp. S190]|uniref:SDR family NAD(P)-dependent oxidoreductase n=1 Tax=Granulicella sp. S190 TaxID=1747226 RepID=UPI00131BFB8B|nr:glucose 1-dehydrogenase [Granulicella sp. S190]
MRLRDKVALITGGNSGIGLATAKLFVSEGAKVAITGRDQKTLDAAALELGDEALVIQANVTDQAAMERAIVATVEKFDKLDVVFTNAGTGYFTPLGGTSAESFENILNVNVTSTFLIVQACLPHLKQGASIILNSSVQNVDGKPRLSAYAASKSALRTMVRAMASELSPRGIRVNAVSPGSIDTPIWDNVAPSPKEKKNLYNRLKRSIPLGRVGTPLEVAYAVLFLASDESSFIQAAEIVIDGGATGAMMGAPIYNQ